MLRELSVKNFAIIDKLEISLSGGLTCLTGETGAGKSILADAVGALLGARAGAECVKDNGLNAAETAVEGVFDLSGLPDVKALLDLKGIPADDQMVVRRVIAPRGRAYINGSLVNLSVLQEIGERLADIHGQHDHQSLLKPDRQIKLLDEFCMASDIYSRYLEKYRELSQLKAQSDSLEAGGRERAQRLDLLLFQRGEIDKAGLSPAEEDELKSERLKLMHADRLRTLSQEIMELLKGSESPALTAVGEAKKAVKEIEALTGSFEETVRLVEGAEVSLVEACAAVRDFERGLDSDPERLSIIEERLDLINRLKKKYSGLSTGGGRSTGGGLSTGTETVAEVLAYREALEAELQSLDSAGQDTEGLKTKIIEAESALLSLGRELSEKRKAGGEGMAVKVLRELSELGMEKAAFKVEFYPQERPGPQGMEKAEFLFSANPGEGIKTLAKIASGGELSRVMLALKVILSEADRVPTLIFDEVDSGIGGRTAAIVGKKLRQVSTGRQVLCITHLPQIASQANEHFVVEKDTGGSRTKISIKKLDKDERVREVARMLGDDHSSIASAHAAELVERGGGVV